MEVDHGPFLVDNNIFLSPQIVAYGFARRRLSFTTCSQETSRVFPFDGRKTPLHKAHSTELAGLHNNPSGDVRYYNNLFMDHG